MHRLSSLVLALLLAGFLAAPARAADSTPGPSPEPASVTEEQEQGIRTALKTLYDAYKARNLETVMSLIQGAVESSAQEYAGRHPEQPQAAQAIREAFQAFHEDIFQHKDYLLLDFNDGFAEFTARPDGTVEVVSNVPIIATDPMTFTDSDGTPTTVRLRLGRFVFKPEGQTWKIVEMNLF